MTPRVGLKFKHKTFRAECKVVLVDKVAKFVFYSIDREETPTTGVVALGEFDNIVDKDDDGEGSDKAAPVQRADHPEHASERSARKSSPRPRPAAHKSVPPSAASDS